MIQTAKYRIIIGGGGTGGHVFPAISIANALRDALDNTSFLFVGARGKLEMEKVTEAGYEIVGLPVTGFQRRLTIKNLTFFFKLIRSMQISRKLIRTFKPDVAIGVGGYASGPIIKAAARKNIPVLIQEQNSYAGMTNRLLSKSAAAICVAYTGMEKYFPEHKIRFTGNPIRQDLLLSSAEKINSYKHFGLTPERKVILVIGGSLGAGTINASIIRNIEQLAASDIQVVWQSGSYYYENALEALKQGRAKNIVLLPFIKQMHRAFQVADIIISRAGAGTISELCLIGKPVILVPSPNVAEDHQTRNAESLSERKAAVIVKDKDAEHTLVQLALDMAKDEKGNKILAENIRKMAIPDASKRIANEVIKLLDSI